MSLFDALGAIGTGLRVAGAGMSPEFASIDAQRVENDKTRDEQRKRFLAEILTQHYQQGTINPQAYQQAMSKLGVQLPPIQAAPDYTGLGNEITQKLDSGSYLQGGGGLGGQSVLKDPTSDAAIKTLPQDNVVGQQSAPTDLQAPDVGVNAKSILPYSTAEINQATSEFADKVRSQSGTQAMKAKAIKDFRDNLIKERRSLLDEKDKLSLIKNRDSETKAREREKDTPFLREFKAWKEYDRESDPMGYQLLTDRISRDANGNKTAIRKNIEAKMSAEGLKEGTEAWDEGLAKGMRDYFDSKKKPTQETTKLTKEAIGTMAFESLLFGKNPPGMGNAAASQRAEVANERSRIGRALGLNDIEIATLPQNNKVKMKAVDKLTTWGAFVDKSADQLNRTIDVAIDYARKIGPAKLQSINKAIIAGEKEFNDPDANAYAIQVNTIKNEYGRLMAGPTSNAMLPVEALKKADDLIGGGLNVEAWLEVKKALLRDADITRKSVNDQKNSLLDSIKEPGKKEPTQETPPPASQSAPMTATNPKTGERIQSDDGGKTWHPVK